MISLKDDVMPARAVADDPLDRWRAWFDEVFALVAVRFAQMGSRHRTTMYLLGLLSGAVQKKLLGDR